MKDLFLVAEKLGYSNFRAKMERKLEQSLFIHSCNEVALAFNNLEKLKRLFDLDDDEEQTLLISALTHDAGKKSSEFSSYLDVVREFKPKFNFLMIPRVEHVAEQEIENDVREAVRLMGYDDSTVDAATSCCLLHHRKSGAETRISALMKEHRNVRTGLISDLLTFIDHICSIMHFHDMRAFMSSGGDARIRFLEHYLHLEACNENPDIIFPSKRPSKVHGVRVELGRKGKSSRTDTEIMIGQSSPPFPVTSSLWKFLSTHMKDKIEAKHVYVTVEYSQKFKQILRRAVLYYRDLVLKVGYESDPELSATLTAMCEKASVGDSASLHDAFKSLERDYHNPSLDFENNWNILTRKEMPSINPYDLTENNNLLGFLWEAARITGWSGSNGEL